MPTATAALPAPPPPRPPLRPPPDLLRIIFAFFPPVGLWKAAGVEEVCKAWCRLAWGGQFRDIDTTKVHPAKVLPYLIHAVKVVASPLSVSLRLGLHQWALLPWLLANIDVSRLQQVELYNWWGGLPMPRGLADLPHPVRSALAAASVTVIDGDATHRQVAPGHHIVEGLDLLPALRGLSIILNLDRRGGHDDQWLELAQGIARLEGLTTLSCHFGHLPRARAPGTVLCGLRTLTCHFCTAAEVEECLALLPLLQELQVIGIYKSSLRLISPRLERVCLARANKMLYISYVYCPRLRLVQGRAMGPYGTGFIAVPAENPLEGIIQHEYWDSKGRVFSKAAGFIFCGYGYDYEYRGSLGHITDNYRLIEYGEGGEPAADCEWRHQGCDDIVRSER